MALMKFLQKIKLLFKIQKPAGDVVAALKDAKDEKRGWKTIGFWVTLIGTGISTAGALSGLIPAQLQLCITTGLQCVYNVLRGAQNMDSPTVKGTVTTTEFWLTSLTELQKAVVVLHDGGIQSHSLEQALSGLNFLSLAFGQNLAARKPVATKPA